MNCFFGGPPRYGGILGVIGPPEMGGSLGTMSNMKYCEYYKNKKAAQKKMAKNGEFFMANLALITYTIRHSSPFFAIENMHQIIKFMQFSPI